MKVIHFIRKSSQLKASFIQNQIISHKRYSPSIVFKVKTEQGGGYGFFNNDTIKITDLSKHEVFFRKWKFKLIKLISSNDVIKMAPVLDDTDVLHFHFGTDAGIYLPLLKNVTKPKIVSFYGYDCSSFPKRFLGLGKSYLQQRVFKLADVVLAMSEDMREDLIKLGCPKEKVRVHYHGIPLSKFYKKRNYAKNDSLTSFLIISGLTSKKGHLFLLKSFKKAFDVNKNIRLTIVGSGATGHDIDNFIQASKMAEYVSVFPQTAYASSEHVGYLNSADVFIHPSITTATGDKEGIPGAIVEAMATGLPVISTFHAGIPHIIQNRLNGILVPENDVDKLTQAILQLARLSELREQIGVEGQKVAMSQLDLIYKEMALESIYDSVIHKNKLHLI